jgi:hypothetical protein
LLVRKKPACSLRKPFFSPLFSCQSYVRFLSGL